MSDRRKFDEDPTRSASDPADRPRRLGFGRFVADPETGRLTEEGRVVPLAPKPFETLCYLAQRSGRVIPKAELVQRLWPDTFVTEDVLVQCVMEIRRALGDPAKAPQYIQTLPRRGYQFIAPAHVLAEADAEAGTTVAPAPATSRRWRAVAGAAAALVVGAAIGAWLTSRSARARIETAGASAEVAAVEPGSLLVMPIAVEEAQPESRWLRNGLSEMIRGQLGQTRGIHAVPRPQVAAAMRQAGIDEDGTVPADRAGTIARGLRAEWLVTGSYVRLEDRFVLTAEVLDVGRARSQGTAVVRGRHPADLLVAVDELCLKLMRQLRPEGPTAAERSAQTAGLATRSVDASRQYVEALEVWFGVGGRHGAELAEAKLEAALKLDPGFAQAYVKKAQILQWRAQLGYGQPDARPAVVAAARLAQGLPEREQLLVRSLEALILRNEPAVAQRHLQSLLEVYPTYAQETGVPGLLLETLMRRGEWDEIIKVGRAQVAVPSLPDDERGVVSSLLAQAYHRKGEYGPALENARRAVQLWPRRDAPEWLTQRVFLGRICLDAGRIEEALTEFRAVPASPESDVTNLTQAAWGLYMAGESAEAAALVERAVRLDDSYGNAHHLRGWIRLAASDYGPAAESLEAAYRKTPAQFGRAHQGLLGGDLAALYYAGVAYLKAGRADRAAQTFGRVADHCQRMEHTLKDQAGSAARWQAANFRGRARARLGGAAPEPPRLADDDTTYFVQSARLHAVQGQSDLALSELAQGLALGFREYRHIQDDPDFESLRDKPEFVRLVTAHLERPRAAGRLTASTW
jgi:DNA-binding winged helix-turn-helix (wHTH) protein/tetratricopeptide (TPR) repeat protein/TolB-like protein